MMDSYEITIINRQEIIFCHENESILEAMRRQSLDTIIHGCYGGGCGRCRIRIISGAYTIRQKMSRQHISLLDQNNNIVLACCVEPKSDMDIKIE